MELVNTQSARSNDLPAIVCLHGAGTSGEIFRLQSRMILQKLKTHFRFIFVDAPFIGHPGPGVLPAYAGMKPYRWWHCDESSATKFNITIEEIRQRRQQVRELIAKYLKDPSVVGVMAFSQGTRLATGLCLDHELRRHIKFAILIAATFPALTVEETQCQHRSDQESNSDSESPSESEFESESELSFQEFETQIEPPPKNPQVTIPSVHIQGRLDPWAVEGNRLRTTYFQEDKTRFIQFAGGHAVPVAKADTERVVLAVMAAWNDTRS